MQIRAGLNITFFLYNLVNCSTTFLNNEIIEEEFKRHNKEVECPAGGTEHKPTFIASLLQSANATFFRNLESKTLYCTITADACKGNALLTKYTIYLSMFRFKSFTEQFPLATCAALKIIEPDCSGFILINWLFRDHALINISSISLKKIYGLRIFYNFI